MALQKQGAFTKEPNDLPDVPSNFYSPEEIKSFWQTPVDELKDTLNKLIDALVSGAKGSSGASEIGTSPVSGLEGKNVQSVIQELKQSVDDVVLGQIPDASLTPEKLNNQSFTQQKLWEGAIYLNGDQTIRPSKKLSECRNGWILVWSDFDDPSTANDFQWFYTYVPKCAAGLPSQHYAMIPQYHTATANEFVVKTYYLGDESITGHDDNSSADNFSREVAIRYIYEW